MPRIRYSNFTWTKTQVTQLRKMWKYKSATIIGKIIGKSRSAVLGKVKRLRLRK